jgi:hypothetical protein
VAQIKKKLSGLKNIDKVPTNVAIYFEKRNNCCILDFFVSIRPDFSLFLKGNNNDSPSENC